MSTRCCTRCNQTKDVSLFTSSGTGTQCKDCRYLYQVEYLRKKRLLVLTYYGGDPPRCACCHERRVRFLAIDHINGGGNRHRKEQGVGQAFVWWLLKQGLPEGYRVLCHNCNMAVGFYGICPHEEERQ